MKIDITERQHAIIAKYRANVAAATAAANSESQKLADIVTAMTSQDLSAFVGFNYGQESTGQYFVILQEPVRPVSGE